MKSIRALGWPTSSPGSLIIRLRGCMSCCHGTGSRLRKSRQTSLPP